MHVANPKQANALGIEVVYQDLALCDNLDIVENLYLGREALSTGFLDEITMEERAAETLAGLSVRTVKSVRQKVASLSGGQRQTVAIARAVLWNSKLVVLDEPTAALGVAQTEQVLRLVRRLADRGLAVILISHNMNDVLAVADDIAVLYLGQLTAQVQAKDVSPLRGRAADHRRHPRREGGPAPGDRPARDRPRCTDRRDGRPVMTAGAGAPDDLGARADRSAGRLPASTSRGCAAATSGRCPAILGLTALVVIFSALRPETFTNPFNFANLLIQSAPVIVIAMGLVFVLLHRRDRPVRRLHRRCHRRGAGRRLDPARLALVRSACSPACVTGAVIGLVIGLLVARVGIPSFVVTLAGFLALQGLLLADHR